MAARRVGRYTLEHVLIVEDMFDWYQFDNGLSWVIRESAYMWVGCVIFGAVAALVANIAVRLLWLFIGKSVESLRASRHTATDDDDDCDDEDYYEED
jgi:hypothetical protein